MPDVLRPRSVRERTIGALVDRLPGARLHGDAGLTVTGITHDSGAVRPGDVYLARSGARTHGIAHAPAAVAAGAVAVLTDPESVPAAVATGVRAVVEVADPQLASGAAAAWVYGDPSRDLVVIGVTGTNGKTTTAYLVEAGLRAAGRVTGLIGTIETRIAGEPVASVRTTPEATDLHALFAAMREHGVEAVAMEVSSHALALGRVAGTTFDVVGFTNLSQDHLDFHRDMEDYFAAKAALFTPALARRGVVCVDDEWGRRLAATAGVPVTTVGACDAAWTYAVDDIGPGGTTGTITGPDGARHPLAVALPGLFNLRNAALAFVVLVTAGVPADAAGAGIRGLASVPGRMERVDEGQPFTAVVDYAHTPDAVAGALAEARALAAPGSRVIAVLGCGGDRDRGKRPLMGAAAATGADLAVLTSDNPRSEDPHAILDAMLAGARDSGGTAEIVVEPDRAAAIAAAVAAARPGDVLVVAGKGHEQGQEVHGEVRPFDDRAVLRAAIGAAGQAGGDR